VFIFEENDPMKNTLTLQSLLSPSYLKEWAGNKVFERGENYYHENCVTLKHHFAQQVIGEVEGTQVYRVEWRLDELAKHAAADCTCPAMAEYGVCKHAVALGLILQEVSPPSKNAQKHKEASDLFSETYPNIAGWVKDGWIEIGRDGNSTSLIRVLDEGGLVWEGGTRHTSMDKILKEADQAIAKWMEEN
jgi:hypothetical protein